MLDFAPLNQKEVTWLEFSDGMTVEDLRRLTNQMVDRVLSLIADSTDADVVFDPDDPEANDTFAVDEAEVHMPWTLGHIIVHMTASSEEAAALAAELARGVEWHGRSRSEVPWRSVTTIEACRQRLEESRRMRLASLDMWPDEPHLDNIYQRSDDRPQLNAVAYFLSGLRHADSHLAHVADVVGQAKKARSS